MTGRDIELLIERIDVDKEGMPEITLNMVCLIFNQLQSWADDESPGKIL